MKASLTDFVFWFPGILIHHTRREHVDTAKGRLEEIRLDRGAVYKLHISVEDSSNSSVFGYLDILPLNQSLVVGILRACEDRNPWRRRRR